MRILICSNSRDKGDFPHYTIENLGRRAQIFIMPHSHTPSHTPEIITPAIQRQLEALEETHDLEAVQLERLEALANLMDARFNIPFVPLPIGLDTIVGLIPGIGDTISLGVAGFIVAGARKLGLPKRHLLQMGFNIFIDWIIGLIPVIGDLFDIGWQGNLRNVKIARIQIESRWAEERAMALEG